MAHPDLIARLNGALADTYRIERDVGEGGMASVFLAEDLKHRRKVAIKVLKPELSAVVGAERFLAEIETTAGLQHPHILPLFDSGEADGLLYYVMPFVEGESLRDRLDREGQLPVDDALRLVADVAEALHHAHRRGVVHRDIKPANILIQDGRPLVADFGISLALGSAGGTRLTETGLSLGTPYYMSPEQAMGDAPVTQASDIYALACVLYELLAGEPPFTAGTAQGVLARIITGGTPSVRAVRPAVPQNVDAALRKALERVPVDRFSSAGDFRDALADPDFRYGDDEVPATSGSRIWIAAGAATIAGLALGLAGGMALGGDGSGPGVGSAQARPLQLTFTGQARAPAISPQGDFVAYVDVACRQGTFGDCTHSLQVKEVGSTTAVTVLESEGLVDRPRWTHDGASLVVFAELDEDREGLFIVPRLGGAVRLVGPGGAFDTHPAGDSVVVVPSTRPHVGRIIATGTGEVVDSVPMPDLASVDDIAWHPDGGRFAVSEQYSSVTVVDRDGRERGWIPSSGRPYVRWNVEGDAILQFRIGIVREDDLVSYPVGSDGAPGSEVRVLRAGVPTIYRGQFDVARRTGRVVVSTGDARGDLWAFQRRPGGVDTRRVTGGTTWYSRPGISWDGRTAYYLRGDARGDNLYSLDLESGLEEALTVGSRTGGWSVRLSADGSRMAYWVGDGEQTFVETLDRRSGRIASAPYVTPLSGPLPFGDQAIFLSRGGLAVVDSLGAPIREIPVDGRVSVEVPATLSPDATTIAYVAVDADGGTAVATLPIEGGVPRILTRLPTWEAPPGLVWDPEGTLWVGRWLRGDAGPSLWRWREGEAAPTRDLAIPVDCFPGSIVVALGGDRGMCQVEESRFDIWAFEGIGG